MKCPKCTVDLRMSDRQGVEIDYCPQCRGVWLDRGELDKILERSSAGRRYDEDDDDDDDERYKREADYNRNYPQRSEHDQKHYGHGHPPRKRKYWLGEIFDFGD